MADKKLAVLKLIFWAGVIRTKPKFVKIILMLQAD